MSGKIPTQEKLRELLEYNADTGSFVWRRPIARCLKAGDPAGYVTNRGYRIISVLGRPYMAHRLAWLYVHGHWPAGEIDHVNHDRLDCRIKNLREATRSQNLGNMRRSHKNNSGHKGVCWDRSRNKWVAYIGGHSTRKYLGRFDTLDAARTAYAKAASSQYGEFAHVE